MNASLSKCSLPRWTLVMGMRDDGDSCGYCVHRRLPTRLSDQELARFSVTSEYPNPSGINSDALLCKLKTDYLPPYFRSHLEEL